MFKCWETHDRIVASFTDAKIFEDSQIREASEGLLGLCHRAASTGKKLIVDFRGVQFMTSAMIGKLVLLQKSARQHSVDLRLANVSGNVLEVFKAARLHKVFGLLDDDDDDGPDLLGSPVPLPKPPSTDSARAEPPED